MFCSLVQRIGLEAKYLILTLSQNTTVVRVKRHDHPYTWLWH